jgi:hypothetical protein
MIVSVNTAENIRHENERLLARALQGILARVHWLRGWRVEASRDPAWDLTVSGPAPGGGRVKLFVECKKHFPPSAFLGLSERPAAGVARVLAMPYVSPRMAALCEEHGWGWFDLAGNCRLEIPGVLLIERSGIDPVRIEEPPSANLSTVESGFVVRALLAPENAGVRWTQRGVVEHFESGAAPSLALVNKVVQYLREQAFVEELPNRGFRVRDPEGLLRKWSAVYRFSRRSRRRYFSLLSNRALHEKLRGLATRGLAAYGAFSAAEVQAPHVRQARIWLYLDAPVEKAFAETAEAKIVDSGENLVVLIPHDPGIFYGLDESEGRLACTNAVQTYVDLLHAGGRGEEAAEAVLQQRLRVAWRQ